MLRPRRTGGILIGSVLLSVSLGALTPHLGAAQEEPVTEGAVFLLLPTDPKAVGLGRAVTALPGPESVWWNPAGLGELDEDRILVFRGDNFGGEATAASLTLTRSGLGTVAFSYQLLDFGSVDQTDDRGNVTGTVTFREHLGVLSLATSLWDHLNLGVNVKLVQDRFSCRGQCVDGGVTGTTFAVDAGVQARGLWGQPLRIGALLAHAGPDLQVVNEAQADPLPTRARLAVAYEILEIFMPTEELNLWLTAEVDDRWRDPGDPSTYLGSEFQVGTKRQMLRVRAGYVLDAETQVDGASVGLGLRYESFDLALAKSLASSIFSGSGEPVHVSFGFVF